MRSPAEPGHDVLQGFSPCASSPAGAGDDPRFGVSRSVPRGAVRPVHALNSAPGARRVEARVDHACAMRIDHHKTGLTPNAAGETGCVQGEARARLSARADAASVASAVATGLMLSGSACVSLAMADLRALELHQIAQRRRGLATMRRDIARRGVVRRRRARGAMRVIMSMTRRGVMANLRGRARRRCDAAPVRRPMRTARRLQPYAGRDLMMARRRAGQGRIA